MTSLTSFQDAFKAILKKSRYKQMYSWSWNRNHRKITLTKFKNIFDRSFLILSNEFYARQAMH